MEKKRKIYLIQCSHPELSFEGGSELLLVAARSLDNAVDTALTNMASDNGYDSMQEMIDEEWFDNDDETVVSVKSKLKVLAVTSEMPAEAARSITNCACATDYAEDVVTEMFNYNFSPLDGTAANLASQELQKYSAHLAGIGMFDYVEKASRMAKILGYNPGEKDKQVPQCKVDWSRVVEAVSFKLTQLGWPCALKTTVLADLRLLPYGRNQHIWELDLVPGSNDRCFRIKISKVE